MISRLAPLALLCACGRIGFLEIDAASSDGALDALALGEFGAPVMIGEVSTAAGDDDPTATGNLLELYFASNRNGPGLLSNLFRSTRLTATAPWSAPLPVLELNTTFDEDTPGVARDGLTIWFVSSRGGDDDLWVSTRADRSAAWGVPSLVSESAAWSRMVAPEVSRSALRMVLCRGGERQSCAVRDDAGLPDRPLATAHRGLPSR